MKVLLPSLVTTSLLSIALPLTAIAVPPGPEQVRTFVQTHRSQLASSPKLRTELDDLCNQRDCDASELFWYTDWDAAKAAAQASGKPILSLRLLGNLDEDLSCANSRFFRVALYPNRAIRQVLQERYILHWKSVRPVPKVTVDFGDGRKLDRTLTGNSIHYITTATGQPIDALPGLYGPQAFLRHLQQGAQVVQDYQARPASDRSEFLMQYHRDRLAALQTQWANDLTAIGAKPPTLDSLTATPNSPTAIEAGRLAMSKMIVENPLVMAARSAANRNQTALTSITDAATWQKLADRHAADAKLDSNSHQLMQRKLGVRSIDLLKPTIKAFENSMAIDSIRNEYLLHSQLHQWFLGGTRNVSNIDTLNARVYEQLFLTPDRDPWLGLMGPDSFSAIDRDGLRQ
jgi:hypothetical protein